MNKFLPLIVGVIMLLLFSGCEWLFGPIEEETVEKTSLEQLESHKAILEARNGKLQPAGTEFIAFSNAFMQTFEVEHNSGLEPQTLSIPMPPVKQVFSAKATIDPGDGIDFSQTTGSFTDYPEPDLTTDYVIADASGEVPGDDVYKITVTTTYPPTNEVLDEYIEEYYVRDEAPVGTWTIADPIVDDSGSPDQKYRTRMEMHFDDGSVRYETIVKMIFPDAPELNDGGQDENGFGPFSILGSLDYPDLAYPVSDSDAVFSSVVVYTHEMVDDYNFTYWSGTDSQDIIGVRYYTEHMVDEDIRLKGTIVAYEKTVSTLVSQDGTLLDQLQDLFVGSEHDVLAESVFRKEVVFEIPDGGTTWEAFSMNSIMRAHVVDISDYTDEEIQLFNDDELKDLDWSGGTYYIPSGVAAEIEEVPTDDEVIYYDKEGTYVENPADPTNSLLETIAVTFQGPSDLAVLYRAITDGVVADTVTGGAENDIPETLDGVGEVNIYDGDIGTSVSADQFPVTTTAGTVEAWVYVDKHVNWGGIVHKGIEADFSDESFSLQFVDNKGKVAFAIAQQDPSYRYKLVKTNKRLNLDAWYYIVGTWDADAVSVYIFGDGGLVASKSANNNIGEPYQSDAPLVIGSQLLDEYNSSYGYFGFNGKINGVKVSEGAKDLSTLTTFYETYEPYTVNW